MKINCVSVAIINYHTGKHIACMKTNCVPVGSVLPRRLRGCTVGRTKTPVDELHRNDKFIKNNPPNGTSKYLSAVFSSDFCVLNESIIAMLPVGRRSRLTVARCYYQKPPCPNLFGYGGLSAAEYFKHVADGADV